MEMNREELKAACYAVATNTIWEQRPVDVASIEAVDARFFKIAEQHEELVAEQGRDSNLIVRAVRYLDHVHAMPPMRNDTTWFYDMLQVLVELACPNTEASRELESFYRDIEEGIASSRSDYENGNHQAACSVQQRNTTSPCRRPPDSAPLILLHSFSLNAIRGRRLKSGVCRSSRLI